MLEDFAVLYDSLPYLLKGVLVTLEFIAIALAIGFFLGVPMAVGQVYGRKRVSQLISIYVWFFRGLPVLVLLFLFYFGVFSVLRLNFSAFTSAVVVLGLRSAAYQSQIFRGSIQSIRTGQMLAARSIGMRKYQAVWNIILPQALRMSIPGWASEYSGILKDSAVAYAVGVNEVLTRSTFIANRTYKTMAAFLLCALIFIVLTYVGVKLLEILNRRVAISGFEGGRTVV